MATETIGNETVIELREDDEDQVVWTGTLGEFLAANEIDQEEDREWVEEIREALATDLGYRGGGGAQPVYTLRLARTEVA